MGMHEKIFTKAMRLQAVRDSARKVLAPMETPKASRLEASFITIRQLEEAAIARIEGRAKVLDFIEGE